MTVVDEVKNNPAPASQSINPVPLSLPSILVNAKSRVPQSTKGRARLASSSSSPTSAKVIRQPGKRKLHRLENARFPTAINPHIVRPRPSDYNPGDETFKRYKSGFQQPVSGLVRELSKIGLAPRDSREVIQWRREMDQVKREAKIASGLAAGYQPFEIDGGGGGESAAQSSTPKVSSPKSGLFTMSLTEARFFLKRRAMVESRLDRSTDMTSASTSHSLSSSPVMQSLVDLVEEDLASWKSQVVYLLDAEASGSQADATRLNRTPRVVVPSSSSIARARVDEHHRLPQSISYLVPDSFDRLTVHCLARVWGLRSFSKTITHNGEEVKLTWILKPPPTIRRPRGLSQRRESGSAGDRGHLNPLIRHLARSASGPPTSRTTRLSSTATIYGIDTPPATDISSQSEYEEGEGTDIDTIESASITSLPSSEADSGSEVGDLSDVGEVEEVDEEAFPPLECANEYDPVIIPVSRRIQEPIIVEGAEYYQVEEDADEVESLPSSRGEKDFEADAEGDGE